jgi:hypothetical protein
MTGDRLDWTGYDARHARRQVTCRYRDRVLLGDVMAAHVDPDITGRVLLEVRHFNGEGWPFDPWAADVEVMERDEPGERRARARTLAEATR